MEIRTLYVVYAIFSLLGVAAMTLLWRQNRKRSPEMTSWLVYYILQSLGLLLVTLRGVIPDIFSIILANALIICGTIFLYTGLVRYVGERSSQVHNYVMLGVFAVAHTVLTYVYPSLSLRNANLGLALLYISAQGAWLMLHRVRPELRPATGATGVTFAVFCLVCIVQIIGSLIQPRAGHLFTSGFFAAAVVLAYQMLFIMLTFALSLMVSRRLLMALEDELAERKRTEETLRESREQFQGLVETLYDWVWEVDAEGRYTYVSPQVKDILGYEPQDLLSKTPFDLMSREEAARVSEIFAALAREGRSIAALENINIHKDGRRVVIESNGHPFYDAAGKLKGYRGTDRDITARKLAEETLRQSEEQVRLLLNSTAEAIYGIDLNGDCTFANPSCLRILGYTGTEQLLGRNMHRLIHHSYPDGRAMRVEDCKIYQAFREGKRVHADDEVLWKADGTAFPAEYWSHPQIANGAVTGAVVAFIDITDRKQAQEKLRQSEEKFSRAFQTSPYAIAITRLDDGRFIEVNDAFLVVTGYSKEELLGESSTALKLWVHPEDRDTMVRVVREGSAVVGREFPFRKKNGDVLIGLFSAQRIELPEGSCILASIDDITERKRTEALLVEERQRLAYILEGTNVGTWEWNVQTGFTVFNERWAEMIGYTLAELAPVNIETWVKYSHPDDLARSNDLLEKHFRKELPYYECEARMRHKDGHWIWVLDRGRVATWTEEGLPLTMSGTHQDITTRKLAEEQIRYMATHDMLTGLPSLRLAKDRLAVGLGMARRHKNKAAVMFIDLDGFKAVNDTLGHDAGDHVLKEVAGRLQGLVRETDTVSRVGGDEFLLIATELRSADDAAQIAEKAIQIVSQPITCNGRQTRIGASIGIALYPDQGEDMDLLIKQADSAMYRVKNSGKNGFTFVDRAIH